VNPIPQQLQDLCAAHPIQRLALFGSAVTGQLKPESDLDIWVEFLPESQPSYFLLSRLQRELSTLLGRPVDLATPQALSPYFREAVLQNSVLLYERA